MSMLLSDLFDNPAVLHGLHEFANGNVLRLLLADKNLEEEKGRVVVSCGKDREITRGGSVPHLHHI